MRVFERLKETGDVYLGKYEGWYCTNDETFWLEAKLEDGKCPTCKRDVQWLSEDDWFFRAVDVSRPVTGALPRQPAVGAARSVYNEMMAIARGRARRPLHLAYELRVGRAAAGRRRDVRVARRAAQLHQRDRLVGDDEPVRFAAGRPTFNCRQGDRALPHADLAGAPVGARAAGAAAGLRARLDHGRGREDGQEHGQRGRSVRPRRPLRRGRDALFSVTRGAVRQRLLVVRRKGRAAPQQRPWQRSRQPAAPLALHARALPRRRSFRRGPGTPPSAQRFADLPKRVARRHPGFELPRRARGDLGTRDRAEPLDRRDQTLGTAQARRCGGTRRACCTISARACVGSRIC